MTDALPASRATRRRRARSRRSWPRRRRSATPGTSRRPSGSRCSTTTARCGRRSRCPVQLDFILRTFAAAAEAATRAWRERQPSKAARRAATPTGSGAGMVKRYSGDDRDLGLLLGARGRRRSAGIEVEAYAARGARGFFGDAQPPDAAQQPVPQCGFVPMVELLRCLEAHGFLTFIVSGGDRDFMRPAAEDDLRDPARARRRLRGSGPSDADGQDRLHREARRAFDAGRRSRSTGRGTGRRPADRLRQLERRPGRCCASRAGEGRPALRLVVRHDDAAREVDDQGGADKVLGAGFTEISIRDDWHSVFASE